MSFSDVDITFMKRALELAKNGRATCSPNPMVGALIVCDGKIIGQGWHRKAGEPHAEPNAINSVKNKELLSKSTLYVSLEPCSHYGRTPPCADLIISKKIKRVVIGCQDPFSLVSGRGVKKIRDAGIETTVGVLEKECLDLNRRFICYNTKKRPYVLLKWAQSEDGFINDNISSPYTSLLVHKLRSEYDAILVGKNTAISDNPSLTTRKWSGKNPIRILLDRSKSVPKESNIFDKQAETIVFSSEKNDFVESLSELMGVLYDRKIQSVMVEGGAKVLQSFIDDDLWDEIRVETKFYNIKRGNKLVVKAPRFFVNENIDKFTLYKDNQRKIELYKR